MLRSVIDACTSPVPNQPIASQLGADDAANLLAGQADVVDAVLAANRVFVAVAADALAHLEPEVTVPQFRALVLIDMHRSMSVAHLADALGVVPSTATRMCDRLEAKRLISRTLDTSNRRQMTLTIQPDGRALIEQSTRRRTQAINQLLSGIPEQSQAELAAALGLLVEAAHRSDRTRPAKRPTEPDAIRTGDSTPTDDAARTGGA